MNEPEKIPPQEVINVWQLARAIRFALVVIVLGLSYLSFRSSFAIDGFSQIFTDMLSGRPLPRLTVIVIGARSLFVAVSILVPLAALGTLFLRNLVRSFYFIGALGLVTLVQFIILTMAYPRHSLRS